MPELREKAYQYNLPIRIGRNCWLGAGVIVVPGVTIGENTVIGAGSVVTKDIPANVVAVGNPNPAAMEADTLYVGFWTDKGKADESSSGFLKQLRGKQVFLFGTAGFGGSEEYFNKILKAVQKDLHSSNTVISSFMCQGKMPMSVRQRYENMKKQPLHLPNLDAMIENFDQALSHPDEEDLERLKRAVK